MTVPLEDKTKDETKEAKGDDTCIEQEEVATSSNLIVVEIPE